MSGNTIPDGMTREQAERAARAIFEKAGRGFIESLKTDTHKRVLDTVQDIDGMSEEEFDGLLAERMEPLDEESRKAAEMLIDRKKKNWTEDSQNPLSLREEILLDLEGIIKSFEYRR